MGAGCIKTEDLTSQPLSQIDFHALFKNKLINQRGNFYDLLNFLTKRDVNCLTYIVKALFHRSLNEKISNFVLSFSNKIDQFQPPQRYVRAAKERDNKNNKINSIKKQIQPKTNPYKPFSVQKNIDQIFSISSCPIQNYKEENCQKFFNIEDNKDYKARQQQIQEKLDKLSEALRGAQRAFEMQKSLMNYGQQSRFHEIESQGPSSFISRESPPNKTLGNIKYGNEKIFATSFHSGSPKNQTSTKVSQNGGVINLKKMQTQKQNMNDKSDNFDLKSNYSKRSSMYKKMEDCGLADKYQQIKEFYLGQIARYKEELQSLKKQLVIYQNEKESSGIVSKISGSLLSKQSKQSILDNRKKTQTMRLCSAQVNQQIKESIAEVVEYGTKMSSILQSDHSQPDQDSQSNDSTRKHSNSMLIRLFRDSKMFPIEYSKKSSPLRFVFIRQNIQSIFESFYTPKIYQRNPIERTNMILCFEQRVPKRYCDYLKGYKSWILIGKVSEELYIGAYINLKEGAKTSTDQCFLFSMTKEGKPYILSAKSKIMDPLNRPQYINFGDSEFRIKSGTKNVSLSLQNIGMSFREMDGSEPNTRKFSFKYGENIQLEELEIHQIVFQDGCM